MVIRQVTAFEQLCEEVRGFGVLSVVRNGQALLILCADSMTTEEPANMWPSMQCRFE